ncbi:MAG: alpha/beta fold hydrolase [Chitinophagaceae bacterium]
MMKSKLLLLAIAATTMFFGACKKEININDAGNLVPKTVDQDPTLPSISVNGTQLHAETFGSPADPMVLFLHGGPGGDYRNGLQVKQLAAAGYYVVFYDQRGSGLSKRHPKSSYSLNIMIDDLDAVIQHYKTAPSQKVFLFGHSWGAILAAGYVNKYPARISGAVFAEPGGLSKKLLDEYSEGSRKLSFFAESTNDILYMDQFLTGKKNDHAILDYKLNVASSFTFEKGNAEGIEGASPFWRNGAVVLYALVDLSDKDGFDYTTNLNQFTTKVLFIYGEMNTTYGLRFAQKEAAFFPNSQISKINGTGHEMIYFKWNNVQSAVLPYLNALK